MIPLFKRVEWFGCDANPVGVRWCANHLMPGTFESNMLAPPTHYPDGKFGLIYGLSIFSHLGPELQVQWFTEFRRILAPDGLLIMSTMGNAFLDKLRGNQRRAFLAGEFVVVNDDIQGHNGCAVFSPERRFRENIPNGLRVVRFLPGGAKGNGNQDLWVLGRA
jgi:SAM-dependent methyltransferase